MIFETYLVLGSTETHTGARTRGQIQSWGSAAHAAPPVWPIFATSASASASASASLHAPLRYARSATVQSAAGVQRITRSNHAKSLAGSPLSSKRLLTWASVPARPSARGATSGLRSVIHRSSRSSSRIVQRHHQPLRRFYSYRISDLAIRLFLIDQWIYISLYRYVYTI